VTDRDFPPLRELRFKGAMALFAAILLLLLLIGFVTVYVSGVVGMRPENTYREFGGMWWQALGAGGLLSVYVGALENLHRFSAKARLIVKVLLFLVLPFLLLVLAAMPSREERGSNAAYRAMEQDDPEAYADGIDRCAARCNYENANAERVDKSIEKKAWKVLALQVQQMSPAQRQHLLILSANNVYNGEQKLVQTLLRNGARADQEALANAVHYCRAGMLAQLLRSGGSTSGKFSYDPIGAYMHYTNTDYQRYDQATVATLQAIAEEARCDDHVASLLRKAAEAGQK
jgi:hypothetical protein